MNRAPCWINGYISERHTSSPPSPLPQGGEGRVALKFPRRQILCLAAAGLALAWSGNVPPGRSEGASLSSAIRESNQLSWRAAVRPGRYERAAISPAGGSNLDAATVAGGSPGSRPAGIVPPIARAAVPLSEGGRDPFLLPPPPPRSVGAHKRQLPLSLPPGRRGLIISQLILKGVLADDSTKSMIAVVTNGSNRAYFLRVGDELYDGVVTGIAPAAVYFEEETPGTRGLVSRTVVKWMDYQLRGAPAK
jgi:hypothetical protein